MNRTPIKIKSREELMASPPGLYELPERKPGFNVYDPLLDEFVDGEMREIASVCDVKLLHRIPETLQVAVRGDGLLIVSGWQIVPGTERNHRDHQGQPTRFCHT